jgi:hypothetical protein
MLLTVALVVVLSITSALAAERVGGPRLRPQDPRTVQVLKEGAARSATFRGLVNRIEASNLIVYIAVNPIMKSTLSGALTWMTRAGDFRYVRALDQHRPDARSDDRVGLRTNCSTRSK